MQPVSTTWISPSNIALVKYWGKYGTQYPQNPSVSFTLSKSVSTTTLTCEPLVKTAASNEVRMDFTFEGKPNEQFARKIAAFLTSMQSEFPFLSRYEVKIDSQNSFPHSSGIASSASGMSALALCLCTIEQKLSGVFTGNFDAQFWQKASRIARLGSGSACRSVYPQAALWGACGLLPHASQEFAIPYEEFLHPVFKNFNDTILIVSQAEKSVSSRAGHALMQGNPYAPVRYAQANQHLETLHTILQTGNMEGFIELVELEALELHALMMSSTPSYMLMQPNTLAVINLIRQFRQQTGLPVCFTLDAGPNVHVLYPHQETHAVSAFIKESLLPYCVNEYCIWDKAGNGPILCA